MATAAERCATSVIFEEQIEVPLNIRSLEDFSQWTRSDAFPERGRIDYIGGNIEVDMQAEELHSHGSVKVELVVVLGTIVKNEDLGELFTDRTRIASAPAHLSCEPDVVFVSHKSIKSGNVQFVAKSGREDRFVEVQGAPDLVVEIVSDASVEKDSHRLPLAYYSAGVQEYWLIDARGENLVFQIHHRGTDAFEPVKISQDAYQRSAVLARSFQLGRSKNRHGHWTYDLHEKR